MISKGLGQCRGFTLIEFLLGLLIFSILAAGLYGTFRGGLSISRRAQDVNAGYREIRWIIDQLAVDLENAVVYDFSGSYPGVQSCEGAPDRIRIILDGPSGLEAVTYSLEDPEITGIKTTIVRRSMKKPDTMILSRATGEHKVLVRTKQSLAGFLNRRESGEREVIGSFVRDNGLKFSYAGARPLSGGDIPWQPSWSKSDLPSMVRMELTLAGLAPGQRDISVSRDFWIPMGNAYEYSAVQ